MGGGEVEYLDDSIALLVRLHARILRGVCRKMGVHFQGLAVAARQLQKRGVISSGTKRRMLQLETAAAWARHVSIPMCRKIEIEVFDQLDLFKPMEQQQRDGHVEFPEKQRAAEEEIREESALKEQQEREESATVPLASAGQEKVICKSSSSATPSRNANASVDEVGKDVKQVTYRGRVDHLSRPGEWEPLINNDVELSIPGALSFPKGQGQISPVRNMGSLRVKLSACPSGYGDASEDYVQASIGVEFSAAVEPSTLPHEIPYQICLVNWFDRSRSVVRSGEAVCVYDDFDNKEVFDIEAHAMVPTRLLTPESGWLGPDGSLYLRARLIENLARPFAAIRQVRHE
jgi:hypothetical protein